MPPRPLRALLLLVATAAVGLLASACAGGARATLVSLDELAEAAGQDDEADAATEADSQQSPVVIDALPSRPRRVAIVGDSISVRTEDEYRAALPGDVVTVEALTGASISGMRSAIDLAVAESPDVLVVELGTNDAPKLEPESLIDVGGVLRAVTDLPCVRWVTISIPGENDDQFNQVLRDGAEVRDNVELVEWAQMVEEQEGLLDPDEVHPTDTGQLALAEAVAESVRDCDGTAAVIEAQGDPAGDVTSAGQG